MFIDLLKHKVRRLMSPMKAATATATAATEPGTKHHSKSMWFLPPRGALCCSSNASVCEFTIVVSSSSPQVVVVVHLCVNLQ